MGLTPLPAGISVLSLPPLRNLCTNTSETWAAVPWDEQSKHRNLKCQHQDDLLTRLSHEDPVQTQGGHAAAAGSEPKAACQGSAVILPTRMRSEDVSEASG